MQLRLLSDQRQQVPGCLLFRYLLARAAAQGPPIFARSRLHSKGLLMLGTLFVGHAISGKVEVLRLKIFLQRRLVVDRKELVGLGAEVGGQDKTFDES